MYLRLSICLSKHVIPYSNSFDLWWKGPALVLKTMRKMKGFSDINFSSLTYKVLVWLAHICYILPDNAWEDYINPTGEEVMHAMSDWMRITDRYGVILKETKKLPMWEFNICKTGFEALEFSQFIIIKVNKKFWYASLSFLFTKIQ